MKKLTPEELKQYRKEYYLKNKDKIKAYYWKKKAERQLAES